jgi:mono/diheme cytochrome c family protein
LRRALRWMMGSVFALCLISGAGFAWVYFASQAHLHSYEKPPAFTRVIRSDADSITHGKHLVDTRGCRGCHGATLGGEVMWGYAVAPNLPALVREHGIAALEAGMRHGIAVDGTAMYSMPAFSFIHLRDEDVAAIAAYLMAEPVRNTELPAPTLPWGIRYAIARGEDKPIAGFLDQVPPLQHAGAADTSLARGEYIAMTTCIECHGFRLRGDEHFGGPAPSLVIVGGYDQAAFTKLMRTGKALGDRELPMMSPVARSRFVHLADEELADLHEFLRTMTP